MKKSVGFTIVELLVVIVIIGILATITAVAYSGISEKATVASLQSDLDNSSIKLKIFQVENGVYPLTIDCGQPDSATNLCLSPSNGAVFTYDVDNSIEGQTFGLSAVATNGTSYRVINDSTPIACPLNFIIVPGNINFGTSNFCVMKYEAKQVGSTNVPISQAAGSPWVNISQTNAIAYSKNVANCKNCRLISDVEWLTIAHNVLSVPSNWGSGVVGGDYIFSGHNDGNPDNALAADADDNNGYFGTGNSSILGANQRRTLRLTNGEVIWDFAGNIDEWESNVMTGGTHPGLSGGTEYIEMNWNDSLLQLNGLNANVLPSYGTPGAGSWTIGNGLGGLFSNAGETNTNGYIRGGAWSNTYMTGIFALHLNASPSTVYMTIGFRVVE